MGRVSAMPVNSPASKGIRTKPKKRRKFAPTRNVDFDLIAATEEHAENREQLEGIETEPKFFTMYGAPMYIARNVRFLLSDAPRLRQEDALSIALKFGLDRLNNNYEKELWLRLSLEATGKGVKYRYDEHRTLVCEFVETLHFSVDTSSTGSENKNFRVPEEFRKMLSGIAKPLGVKASTLAQVCIIDALRIQPDVAYLETMDESVETFYRKLHDRVRLLAAHLKALEPELSDEAKEVIEEIGL